MNNQLIAAFDYEIRNYLDINIQKGNSQLIEVKNYMLDRMKNLKELEKQWEEHILNGNRSKERNPRVLSPDRESK